MNFEIENGTCDLLILADAEERSDLAIEQKENPGFYSDAFMWDQIECVWTNGLSSCIRPEDVGALTDAPMLCESIADDGSPRGKIWAYMSYQVRSVLEDLIDYGSVRWQYGGTMTEDGFLVDESTD